MFYLSTTLRNMKHGLYSVRGQIIPLEVGTVQLSLKWVTPYEYWSGGGVFAAYYDRP
jgi:hypothetical protein